MALEPTDWMPFNVRKYLGKTMRLTRDQHGGYLMLLMAYWMGGGPLPDNDDELAAIVKATKKEWKALRPVLAQFFEISGGQWVQEKAEKELSKARGLMAAKSAAGRKGAETRWQKDGRANGTAMADASNSQRQTDAPIPIPRTHTKTEELNSFVVGRVGKKVGGITIKDPNERIARFQKKIAEAIGKDGWLIVGAAADPQAPDHDRALEVCKRAAQQIGKGWPQNWPAETYQ